MYLLISRGCFGGKGELGRGDGERKRTKGMMRKKRRKMKLKNERGEGG